MGKIFFGYCFVCNVTIIPDGSAYVKSFVVAFVVTTSVVNTSFFQKKVKTLHSRRHRNRMRVTLFHLPIIPEDSPKITLDKFSESRNGDDIEASVRLEGVFRIRQENL